MKKNIFIIVGNNANCFLHGLKSKFSDDAQYSFYFLNEGAQIKKFNNGETLVRLFADKNDFDFTKIDEVIIIESLTCNKEKSVNDIFCETEMMIDAIRNINNRVTINLMATGFGYTRQDRTINKPEIIGGSIFKTAEASTLKLRLKGLKNAGLSRLVVFDPHSVVINEICELISLKLLDIHYEYFLSIFGDIFTNMIDEKDEFVRLFFNIFNGLEGDEKLEIIPLETISQIVEFFNCKLMLVAPDAGSSEKVRLLGHLIHQELSTILLAYNNAELMISLNDEIDSIFVKKIRNEPGKSCIADIEGYAKNRDCLIIDDILDTGGTLCQTAEAIKFGHNASSVRCFITHGILSKNAVEKLHNSCLKDINLTNSIVSTYDKLKTFYEGREDENRFLVHNLESLIIKIIKEHLV